jgi:hypothetical protein
MGLPDIGILCTLITSAEQNDNLITADYLHIVKGNPSSLVLRNRTPAKFRSNLSETGKNRRKFPVFGILVIVS